MTDTTKNIPYTALKTAVHRIVQQQPTNMLQLENILADIQDEYRVHISIDDVDIHVKEVTLDNIDLDADTVDECGEILWDCDSAGYPSHNEKEDMVDDTTISQEAYDWLAGISDQAKTLQQTADDIMWSLIRHRDNHTNIIKRDLLNRADDTISACTHLHQGLEETLQAHES